MRKLYWLVVVAVLALPVAVFAQTPETSVPSSGTLLTGAGDAIDTWGLWGFIVAVMLVGLAFMVVRGILRPARR